MKTQALLASLLLLWGRPGTLSAEEWDPNPDEFMNSFLAELEGAVGGQGGTALRFGLEFLKTASPVGYDKEAILGETIALQALASFGRLVQDRPLLEYVSLVGNSVARVSLRPQTPYYFAICDNPQPNAFSAPGGYVFLTTGLLRLLSNEDELAGVLGHEIAHIARQDAIKSVRLSKQVQTLSEGLGTLFGPKPATETPPANQAPERPDYFTVVTDLTQIVAEKGFPLSQETKADEFGTDFAYRAGYQPGGLRDFLQRLALIDRGETRSDRLQLLSSMDRSSLQDLRGLSNHWIGSHRAHGKRVSSLEKTIRENRYLELATPAARAARFRKGVLDRLR